MSGLPPNEPHDGTPAEPAGAQAKVSEASGASIDTAQPAARGRRRRRTPQQRRRLIRGLILQGVAMVGIGLLVYPDAADWFARLQHDSEISGYIDKVEQTPSAERQRILQAAYNYNDQLKPGPLTDPYISQNSDEAKRTAVYQAYEELLRVSGTDVIGTLSYPAIDVALPIYHGTADATISKGVGHLYGTSLPVGGPSTHSVLTAHSGLPQAKLLTNLGQAQVGDTFWISVLGEDHYYRVESIETVLPGETDSLKITEGEDWVTLFSCTPIGVNSHRLMVHAIRVDAPADGGSVAIAGDGLSAGFPWWAVWFIGGSTVTGLIIFAPPRRKRAKK